MTDEPEVNPKEKFKSPYMTRTEGKSPYMTRTEGNWKFILMMASFIILAFIIQGAQNRQDTLIYRQNEVFANVLRTQRSIEANQMALLKTQDLICDDRNFSTGKLNNLIKELKLGVNDFPDMTADTKRERLDRYDEVIIKPIVCLPPK